MKARVSTFPNGNNTINLAQLLCTVIEGEIYCRRSRGIRRPCSVWRVSAGRLVVLFRDLSFVLCLNLFPLDSLLIERRTNARTTIAQVEIDS